MVGVDVGGTELPTNFLILSLSPPETAVAFDLR